MSRWSLVRQAGLVGERRRSLGRGVDFRRGLFPTAGARFNHFVNFNHFVLPNLNIKTILLASLIF